MSGIRKPKVEPAPEFTDPDEESAVGDRQALFIEMPIAPMHGVPGNGTQVTVTSTQVPVTSAQGPAIPAQAPVSAAPQPVAPTPPPVTPAAAAPPAQGPVHTTQVSVNSTQSLNAKAGTFYSIDSLLKFLKEHEGSDIHVSANNWVMIRVRGTMLPLNYRISDQEVRDLISPFLSKIHSEELETKRTVDFSFVNPGTGVFRANVFYHRHGLGFVLRILPEKAPTLDELDVPSILRRSCYTDNGLILVTGPTGSGKSTTLAAMINEINMNKRGHIITIEDPIEFLHDSKKCLVTQRGLGRDFTDFTSALRAALREDPDVILVGEMRDRETMSMAIRAAETGHLVLSTLHTGSAAKSIDRILNTFPADEQNEIRTVLSETLRVVISQKLIPNKHGTKLKLFQDIMVNTRAVANLIREGKTFLIENVMQTALDEGMVLMDKAIRTAAEEGAIRMADAHEMSNDKRIIEESVAFLRNEVGIVETVEKLNREEFGAGKAAPATNMNVPPGEEIAVSPVLPGKGAPVIAKEIIGIKNIVAELKPGYKKVMEPQEIKTSPVHLNKKKPGA